MTSQERAQLLQRMGGDAGMVCAAAERGEWPSARMYMNRFFAAAGILAMEIDENDPVEPGN